MSNIVNDCVFVNDYVNDYERASPETPTLQPGVSLDLMRVLMRNSYVLANGQSLVNCMLDCMLDCMHQMAVSTVSVTINRPHRTFMYHAADSGL